MTRPAGLLELRDVKVARGGAPVLDVPAFRLDEHETVALLGPNGSGKSSLLLTLMALLPRSSGRLLLRGEEVRTRRDELACRRRITMVLQEPLLFDTTVLANVASGLELRGLPRREVARRAGGWLERLGLAHLAERSARKLSGGEARRVSLARALAVEPDVLFLDEPFANLDPPARQSIVEDLERTLASTGTAAILVTHDRADAFRLCRRIAVMDHGRIVQSGDARTVMKQPVDAVVASFVGMEIILDGVIASRGDGVVRVTVAGAELEAAGDGARGQPVSLCLRPEDVTLAAERPACANVVAGRIASIASTGPFLKVKLAPAPSLSAYLTADRLAQLGLAEGAAVFASFDPSSARVLPRAPG
jgi:tungstate transport system ATP-binding protein